MPDLPISALPSLAVPNPSDVFPLVDGGITKQTTVQGLGTTILNQIAPLVGVVSYYGSFYHTGSMTNAGVNALNTMSLSTTDFSNGVSIGGSSSDRIIIANAGVYNIQFSAQVDRSTGGTASDVYIWLRRTGSNVEYTNTNVTTTSGVNAQSVAAWNFFVSASANDYYQLAWSSADINARIHYDATPVGPGPNIPSLIVTVNRVA